MFVLGYKAQIDNIPPAKVNEDHTNRGLGKLLLAAAEKHGHRYDSMRCLDAATCVGTGPHEVMSWCLFFGFSPLRKRSTSQGRSQKFVNIEERIPL